MKVRRADFKTVTLTVEESRWVVEAIDLLFAEPDQFDTDRYRDLRKKFCNAPIVTVEIEE